MRRYETFVIIDPDISQEEREPVLGRVKELITQQDGFLVFEDHWGERKLAYEIKKKARGYYIRFDYCGLAPLVNEIERFFRIDDRALKYMTVVLDKDVDLEKVKEEKAAAESQREAAAESQREAAAETQREAVAETQREAAAESQREAAAETQREAAAESQREAAAESQRESAADTQREAAAETQPEPAPEAPEKAESAELPPQEDIAVVEKEEITEQKPQVEEEAQASDTETQATETAESAEKTTPVEKKEEA